MAQIINTNIASLNAQRNLSTSGNANATALERLSSGLRINSAKDDAAGLAISTRFESQTRGLGQAVRNAGDGVSLAQTAEGALQSMTDNLQRIRELAVQSANGTNSDDDRLALQAEVKQLVAEIERTSEETNFNGRALFDGSFDGIFQIGANAGQTVGVEIGQLTVDRMGASDQVGVSAFGTDKALQNGDLNINGVAIDASRGGDDNASTVDAAASAIAKVEAINRKSDETGVTAFVNDNVAAGASMVGDAQSGTVTINGIDIEMSTTSDTANSRAAVIEAVNAVSDQTGIRAVNTGSAANGVQLVAEDGRNINVEFNGSDLNEANTGLSAGTSYGGYTLIADGDVKEITISGGNGTGRGDLSNSGLSAGTFSRSVAASISEAQSDASVSSTVGTGGDLRNVIDRADNNDTIVGEAGGSIVNTADADDIEITEEELRLAINVNGTEVDYENDDDETVAQFATAVNGVAPAGVTFYERVDFNVTDLATDIDGGIADAGTWELAGVTLTIQGGDTTDADFAENRLVSLMEQINSADFSGAVGGEGSVVAELNETRDEISVVVKNFGAESITSETSEDATVTTNLGGTGVLADDELNIGGQLAYRADPGNTVTVTALADGTELFAADGTYTSNSYGDAALTTTSELDIAVRIGSDSVPVASSPLDAGSSVAQLAAAVDDVSGVTAWEEIALTLTTSAALYEAGDSLNIGGVDVLISGDSDNAGVPTLSSIMQDINRTDFSGSDFDVSAVLNDDADEISLVVRNYSGDSLTISSPDSEGRGITVDGDFVGTQERTMSGELRFVSDDDRDVTVSLADPKSRDEFFVGSNADATFDGPNGLKDGDLLINGVTIGGAMIAADTASATTSSDGSRILSSSKEASAIAIAASINQVSDRTGVTASVNATEVVGGTAENISEDFEAGDQGGIFINGVEVGVVTLQEDSTGVVDTDRARADALNLINQNSGKTGVVAEDNGVSLTLTAADGRNISIAIDDRSGREASIGAMFGMDADVEGIGEATFGAASAAGGVSAEAQAYETTFGTVKLESAGQFTVAGGSNGTEAILDLGLRVGTYGGGEDGQFLRDIDISTFEGATAAITAVDNALNQVSAARSELGAIQNRFESTIGNLEITRENLTAANSRIRDADFAAESAELSRTQVLQQAGISILAQANQRPQQALTLLG